MHLQRDLAWKQIGLLERTSVAYQFADYASGLTYEALPQDVVHQVKRSLLDTLGCAIGAVHSPGFAVCEAAVKEIGGGNEATVVGSGLRTSALNATLVNSFLVRFLDANDEGGGGHNSDAIPSILAVAERQKSTGRDFITSVVISYELGARFKQSVKRKPGAGGKVGGGFHERGWLTDIRAGLTVPPSVGKLMGLDATQIANAIGSAASSSLPLKVLDADLEDFGMRKNLRFGWVAYDSILACILAKHGFTGPVRVVEGECGWQEVLAQGAMNLESLVDFNGWQMRAVKFKSLASVGINHGTVMSTLAIVKENNIKPEDIVAIRLGTSEEQVGATSTPAKKYPNNGETANHSTFYTNAIAIKDRALGPEQYQPEKYADPVVLGLIDKMTVFDDDRVVEGSYGGSSQITTKDGRKFEKVMGDLPHGFDLTDKELEDKFRMMSASHMNEAQMKAVFDAVWHLDDCRDINTLMKTVVFKK
jgi:2-methylcitrate dehydratase